MYKTMKLSQGEDIRLKIFDYWEAGEVTEKLKAPGWQTRDSFRDFNLLVED